MPTLRFKSQPAKTRQIKHARIENEAEFEQHYEFGTQLGKGSFGTVTEVVCITSGKKLAVKIINKEKAGSAAVKLLEREVAIMKKVDHPNIIYLEEVLETTSKMYLVMELCSHGVLEDRLTEKNYFSEKETLAIMQQLTDAVAYMHENDIVHRDLKLDNILLAEPTEEYPYNIKLTDFGLSYTRGGSGSDYMMNQVVGTPIYMAPEVITNYGYSQQCDIWSLGVILFKLITGAPPFLAPTEEELFELIKKGELIFSHKNWKTVSQAAKQLIEGMMKVDPAHRLTSKEILSHPWLNGEQEMNGLKTTNVLEMMKEYSLEQKRLAEKQQEIQNIEIENDVELASDPKSDVIEKEDVTGIQEPSIKKKTEKDAKKSGSSTSVQSNRTGTSLKVGSEKRTRTVPSYMQPTKSSSAPKNPNNKGKSKKLSS